MLIGGIITWQIVELHSLVDQLPLLTLLWQVWYVQTS